jgi:hypothetical protein
VNVKTAVFRDLTPCTLIDRDSYRCLPSKLYDVTPQRTVFVFIHNEFRSYVYTFLNSPQYFLSHLKFISLPHSEYSYGRRDKHTFAFRGFQKGLNYQHHGAEFFLRSRQSLSCARISQQFMEPECSLHSGALHCSLSWASLIQSISTRHTSLISILILTSHLHLCIPSDLFPS